jgi:hypothetical protein
MNRRGYTYFEDFLNGSTSLQYGLTTSTSGGTANGSATDGRTGVVALLSGATASANQRGGIVSGTAQFMLGTAAFRFGATLSVAALPNGTDQGALTVGFQDTATATAGTDSVTFRYLNGGPNWTAVTRSNSGTEVITDTGVAGDTGIFHTFEILVNAAATKAEFYIDNVLVATHTTGIPTGAGRHTGLVLVALRTAATAVSIGMNVDKMLLQVDYPTAQFAYRAWPV